MAAIMKAQGRQSKSARTAQRGRKQHAPGGVRQVHWIGRMVIGFAPRAWTLEAANDPVA
jgi:hypothetical protein